MRIFKRGKKQKPKNLWEILQSLESDKSAPASVPVEVDLDELYPRAVEIIFNQNAASIRLLQKELKLGYANAARLMERMQDDGLVSPYVPEQPRIVLMTRDEWLSKQDHQNIEA